MALTRCSLIFFVLFLVSFSAFSKSPVTSVYCEQNSGNPWYSLTMGLSDPLEIALDLNDEGKGVTTLVGRYRVYSTSQSDFQSIKGDLQFSMTKEGRVISGKLILLDDDAQRVIITMTCF
ncbi:MAG: hypothetical protein IPM97_02590 [Bdellovibrionaceae bacterium]|nr:hypothetical protein [Pseudobdellovibrionaceae bacterium]